MQTPRNLFLMQQTYATLFSLANKLQVKGDQALRGLTSRQLMTLLAITHLPEGEASLNQIARKLAVTKQNVKQLVNALESNGYVVTQPHPRDRRAVNVALTPSGTQALIDNGQLGMAYFLEVFHEFSEEEMESLWALLKKLYRFDGEEQDGFEEEAELH